jgi:hypothetical protein
MPSPAQGLFHLNYCAPSAAGYIYIKPNKSNMVSGNSGIKRPADAEAAVGPSVQTDVFHIDGLMRDILEMTISPGDFKALVRACAPRTQWPVYRKIFTQRLLTETAAKVAAIMDTTLFVPFNQVSLRYPIQMNPSCTRSSSPCADCAPLYGLCIDGAVVHREGPGGKRSRR